MMIEFYNTGRIQEISQAARALQTNPEEPTTSSGAYEKLVGLLHFATQYLMQGLQDYCEAHLLEWIGKYTVGTLCVLAYGLAHWRGLKLLRQKLIGYIKW